MSIPTSGWCFNIRHHRPACRRSSALTDSLPEYDRRVRSCSALRAGTILEMAVECGHSICELARMMTMRKTLPGFRLLIPAILGLALAICGASSARAFDPTSAAGVWQKVEDGKPALYVLV